MIDETTMFPDFEPLHNGVFLGRNGLGNQPGVEHSNKKLCFVCLDQNFLADLLLELSERPDCYFVKFTTKPKSGMFLGRCFLLNDTIAGELWKQYKSHPWLMCTIQDDDFTKAFRDPPA